MQTNIPLFYTNYVVIINYEQKQMPYHSENIQQCI